MTENDNSPGIGMSPEEWEQAKREERDQHRVQKYPVVGYVVLKATYDDSDEPPHYYTTPISQDSHEPLTGLGGDFSERLEDSTVQEEIVGTFAAPAEIYQVQESKPGEWDFSVTGYEFDQPNQSVERITDLEEEQ